MFMIQCVSLPSALLYLLEPNSWGLKKQISLGVNIRKGRTKGPENEDVVVKDAISSWVQKNSDIALGRREPRSEEGRKERKQAHKYIRNNFGSDLQQCREGWEHKAWYDNGKKKRISASRENNFPAPSGRRERKSDEPIVSFSTQSLCQAELF